MPSSQPGTSGTSETPIKPTSVQSGFPIRSSYLKYQPGTFNHMSSRYPWQDFLSRRIYESGKEGIDRVTLSKELGIDGSTKFGNRKVTNYLHMVSKGLPNETGIYQTLTGKCRVKKYYHKSFKPQAFSGVISEISELLGEECPFKGGETVNFPPSKKLTNMKVTDVSLSRIKVIVEAMKAQPAIPFRILHDKIMVADSERGDKFTVDRKTIRKLAYALEQRGIYKAHDVTVFDDDSEKPVVMQVLTVSDVTEVDDERIVSCLSEMKKTMNDAGKSFPHGTLKKFANTIKVLPVPEKPTYKFELETPVEPATEDKVDSRLAKREFYQRKMIRLQLLHEYIFRVVYHPDLYNLPSYSDLFPNEHDPDPRDYADMRVYDETPESFYRFVPPIMPHERIDRGWFTMRMILRAMPLSLYVLIFNMHVTEDIIEYLNDPIRRHILISDLPRELRIRFINKRIWPYVDIACTSLCGLGVLHAAPESAKIAGPIAMYYVRTRAFLYDTTSIEKSYAVIGQSPNEFKKFDYNFENIDDVTKFWAHLRAIALSTPLGARMNLQEEKETYKEEYTRMARENFGKEEYAAPSFDDTNDWNSSLLPGKGACLLDSALFCHLKRHWDMNSVENSFVAWLTRKHMNALETLRKYAEEKVNVLNVRWLSTMQCMSPAVSDRLFKRSKTTAKKSWKDYQSKGDNDDGMACDQFEDSQESQEPPSKKKKVDPKPALKLMKNKGKRQPDMEDIESANKLIYARYRFSPRERDTLILLRAVSQFLNPVGKMWVEPTVVRKIMKAYFPESSDKTVLALAGASVRELGQRRDEIWRLVRGLGSFVQMRKIRDEIGAVLGEDTEAKEEYFCQAFDIAYRHVSRDIPNLPSVLIKDSAFDRILSRNNLVVGTAEPPSGNPMVAKLSSLPKDEESVVDGLMYDWTMNGILAEWVGRSSPVSLAVTAYKGSSLFHATLEKLYEDGVVARSSHNIRSDVFGAVANYTDDLDLESGAQNDNIAAFFRIAYALKDEKAKFSVVIGPDAFTGFKESETPRKGLRDTESGALKLNEVMALVESNFTKKPPRIIPEKFSKVQTMLKTDSVDAVTSDAHYKNVLSQLDKKLGSIVDGIVKIVKKAGINGVSQMEIREFCLNSGLTKRQMKDLLDYLEETFVIFSCGLDVQRYVSSECITKWTLPIDGKMLFMKPWTMPDGSMDLCLFRWFTEMVFITIHEAPYITLESLKEYFCGAIHGAIVEELLDFLEDNKVITSEKEEIVTSIIRGPFKREEKVEKQVRYKPVYNGFELFTLMISINDLELSMGEPEDAVSSWESGWNRLKKFYEFENPEYDMERDVVLRTSRTAFLCGFFIGGISTARDSQERFERHSVGRRFLSKGDAFRRMGDYGIIMFAKNGFRMGIRAVAITGAVMLLTTHTTIFRDKFSGFYFPTFSGLSAFIIHRALACGVFAFPLGIYGQMQALGLGLCTGTMLSGISWLYTISVDKSFADAYKQFKQEYIEDMNERYAEERKVKQLMKDENIKLRFLAYKRLHELEKEKLLEAAEKHDA
ncbi:hypothetical protein FO519_008307 [Halicephalobus sp. NKZ332]|nr:hypothetical protein FO519_008307 [Halicephalobus sp. NKZ332]